jgi:CheY-like chemotaxis protein
VSLSTIDKLAQALRVSTSALLGHAGAELPGQPLELLLVDSRQDAERALADLKRAGVVNRIHVVHDAAQALEFLFCTGRYAHRSADPLPGLVLLDLSGRRESGLDVLRRIKADERTRDIRIVVLTPTTLPKPGAWGLPST